MSRITIEPPVDQWPAVAAHNRERTRRAMEHGSIKGITVEEIKIFRKQVLEKARAYTLANFDADVKPSKNDCLVIAAGHQPVIYHSGVFRKNTELSKAVMGHECAGLNIIIDTDSGKGGEFSYPRLGEDGEPQKSSASVALGGSLFLSQKIKSPNEIEAIFNKVARDLSEFKRPSVNNTLKQAASHYIDFSGQTVAQANTALRRRMGAHEGVAEILLTDLISIPFARQFYARIIESGVDFVSRFNEALNQFRLKRKIKNHANPFPNLEYSESQIDLPFWLIDRQRGERQPLSLRRSDSMLISGGSALCSFADCDAYLDWGLPGDLKIAPRAFMITALFRLFVCDLFVHGLGGAKYDAFLDDFLHAYWGIEEPRFAVVSETRLFFPEEVAELKTKLDILGKTREIQFHLGDYLDNGTFSPEAAFLLRSSWEKRLSLVEQLKQIKMKGDSAHDVTQQLKQVDLEIKNELQKFFADIKVPSQAVQDVLTDREFPFFLFEQESRK